MEKTQHGGLRILFADDEAHLRDLMQMELPRLGHEVTVCPDGASALRALEKGSYDAALLDLRMPGMTGIELCRELQLRHPDVLVIVLTGVAEIQHAIEAMRAGAYDFMTKPVRADLLEIAIKRACEHLAVRRQVKRLRLGAAKAIEGMP